LRMDVRTEWKPEVRSCKPTVEEVGVEDLSFEFPGVAKLAHLKEEGFNAIHITGAWNSWVRNVKFTDADNGLIAGACRFCTFEHTTFKENKREGITGHHALWATGQSQDCLFQHFRLDTMYVHDLTVEGMSSGNVFMKGSGISIDFDHHSNAPYENLFTDLDVGKGNRIWACGGREDRGDGCPGNGSAGGGADQAGHAGAGELGQRTGRKCQGQGRDYCEDERSKERFVHGVNAVGVSFQGGSLNEELAERTPVIRLSQACNPRPLLTKPGSFMPVTFD